MILPSARLIWAVDINQANLCDESDGAAWQLQGLGLNNLDALKLRIASRKTQVKLFQSITE